MNAALQIRYRIGNTPSDRHKRKIAQAKTKPAITKDKIKHFFGLRFLNALKRTSAVTAFRSYFDVAVISMTTFLSLFTIDFQTLTAQILWIIRKCGLQKDILFDIKFDQF